MANGPQKKLKFKDMGLDNRLVAAISTNLHWKAPTLVQEKCIPYILQGKDVLAKARTGSGKTGAYLIPLLQKVLEDKTKASVQATTCLVLGPSKELVQQITSVLSLLTAAFKREITYMNVADEKLNKRPFFSTQPDIVLGTPKSVLHCIENKNMDLSLSLQFFVIDEADLMFAFDHKKDLIDLLKKLPPVYQSFVTSATMPDDLKSFKKLVLHDPVILKLKESAMPSPEQLKHFYIYLDRDEKAMFIYAVFKLNIISGKTIIFVNSITMCYKLHLFMKHFGIVTCVLNPEMPVASRLRIVEKFNRGNYKILIATDKKLQDEAFVEDQGNNVKKRKVESRKLKSLGIRVTKDTESGISRGLDFELISNVVNFDFPKDAHTYTHRVGRTARGTNQGSALSLVASFEKSKFLSIKYDIEEEFDSSTFAFDEFKFDKEELDGLRYRSNEAWQQCSDSAVKILRNREIRKEILKSDTLKDFFRENPKDLEILKNQKSHALSVEKTSLVDVAEYNIPESLRNTFKESKRKAKKDKRDMKNSQKRVNYLRKQKNKNIKADPLRNLGKGRINKKYRK